jgi:hypothetical protein
MTRPNCDILCFWHAPSQRMFVMIVLRWWQSMLMSGTPELSRAESEGGQRHAGCLLVGSDRIWQSSTGRVLSSGQVGLESSHEFGCKTHDNSFIWLSFHASNGTINLNCGIGQTGMQRLSKWFQQTGTKWQAHSPLTHVPAEHTNHNHLSPGDRWSMTWSEVTHWHWPLKIIQEVRQRGATSKRTRVYAKQSTATSD